jgi:hypothetical protein
MRNAWESVRLGRMKLLKDLLNPNFTGHCYVASEVLYHLLGGKEAGLKPMNMRVDGVSHWFLKWGDVILDPTVDQFKVVPDYRSARGRGFLTKEPSRRAQAILDGLVECKNG